MTADPVTWNTIGWAFQVLLQTCFPTQKSNMSPISTTYTCCSLRYWVNVWGDSIVATCSEVSGWSRWSSKIQQDIRWESCWNKPEVGVVWKSHSFLSSAAPLLESAFVHLLSISHSFKFARGFFQICWDTTCYPRELGPSWSFCPLRP